jgi:hypothetical protein
MSDELAEEMEMLSQPLEEELGSIDSSTLSKLLSDVIAKTGLSSSPGQSPTPGPLQIRGDAVASA